MPKDSNCPCGSDRQFARCCEPCLTNTKPAATAEQLMRSRYTAYTLRDSRYLLNSWHSSTRPAQLELENEPVKWLGLKIISSQAGQPGDSEGHVEFIARYKIHGKAHRLHENSHFVWEFGCWLYVDGNQPDQT